MIFLGWHVVVSLDMMSYSLTIDVLIKNFNAIFYCSIFIFLQASIIYIIKYVGILKLRKRESVKIAVLKFNKN